MDETPPSANRPATQTIPQTLYLEPTVDGFAFSIAPQQGWNVGFLIGLPGTFLVYVLGFFVLPQLLIEWVWLPLMVLTPFIWVVPMAYINAWHRRVHRMHFLVDATGLEHNGVRYSWAQVGTPQITHESFVLEDKTSFSYGPLSDRELRKLSYFLQQALPEQATADVPEAMGALLKDQAQQRE